MRKRVIFLGVGALLISGLGLQLFSLGPVHTNLLKTSLESVLEPAFASARTSSLSVGATEFETDAAERILNYDQVLYKNIETPASRFQLFITYWRAGKIEERLVTGHTPDTCWISNGWTCRLRKRLFEVELPGVFHMKRWEYGVYESQGVVRAALFVHLADGDYSKYKVVGKKSISEWLPQALSQGFRTRTEQVFIRITWDSRSAPPYADEVFQDIVQRLEKTFFKASHERS